MKTHISRAIRLGANTLLVVLFICFMLSVAVMGYLSVVEQQGVLSARSQAWNIAIAIVEAGVEDGLQHLNSNFSNLGSDGWSGSGTVYSRTNILPGGNSYESYIYVTNALTPTVVAKGYVRSPGFVRNETGYMFAAGGGASGDEAVARAVIVRCYRGSMYLGAMAARDYIDMHGNKLYTDSFDSENPFFSSGGRYDASKARNNGDIASNSTVMDSINAGNANIHGHVSTGPGGSVELGANGIIGSLEWQLAGNEAGIEPGYEPSQDSNFEFPDVTLPYDHGTTPPSRDIVEEVKVVTTTKNSGPTLPTEPVAKLSTNIIWTSGYVPPPSPQPAGTYSTNITGSGVLPSPVPPTISFQFTPVTSTTNPAPGTYWGTVTVDTKGKQTTYYWNLITQYSYTKWFWPDSYTYKWETYSTNMVTQTNHYDYVLESSTEPYYVTALNGKTLVTANATFVVGNGVTMGSDDVIKIAPGGSLKLHVDGHSLTVAGQGFMNETGLAKNLEVKCTESVTDVSFSGNGGFIGMFVAPNADVTLNGGGADVFDFTGSLMCNTITLNGHFNFHYDEALSRLGGTGRFLISSWDEIPAK